MTDRVLIRPRHTTDAKTFHLPRGDDASKPRCSHGKRTDQWRVRDREALPHRFRLCKLCDPTVTVDRGTTGPTLASQILGAAVDDKEERGDA
jgi:hypothetical protein